MPEQEQRQRAVLRAQGGELEFREPGNGNGARFELRLPLAGET
jgi:hypothetical protein